MKHTHFLVIGSGVAGLTFAIKIAQRFPDKKVTVVTKSQAEESNTKYAQGGIAIVMNPAEDNFKKHIQDTLICGDGLCDPKIVEMVISEGPNRLTELIEWGANFDKNTQGELDLGREGGHSKNRVVHHKDQTGQEIERTILAQARSRKNIEVLDYHFALELITEDNQCLGAYVLQEDNNQVHSFLADYTVLATGGIGQVYGHTTNPIVATGDGIAMAARAQAKTQDMEFIQFHPTAFYTKDLQYTFLISEAVRGFGAYLRTKKGSRFMQNYDDRGELASRDIVSQSIAKELKKSGDDCVYLDCTHLEMKEFRKRFPMIYSYCKEMGIDLAKDWIPVLPAQHYLCGGIAVNKNGQTSISRLFACGECSRTGLHGANRLASNSLLEALVYANVIYDYIANSFEPNNFSPEYQPQWNLKGTVPLSAQFYTNRVAEVQQLMQNYAGIVRNDSDLLYARGQLLNWMRELDALAQTTQITTHFYELKNRLNVAILIVEQSLTRQQNKGGFVKI